jgi:hypothetical protein
MELLGASCAIHGCGILGPELRVVLTGEDLQDLDRVIGITGVSGMRGH